MRIKCSDCQTEIETLAYTRPDDYILCSLCMDERNNDVLTMEIALDEKEQTEWLMH